MERHQGVSMGSFGHDLKKAREAKSVTLETIAAATKITTRYLQAVEQEQFDKLPGGVFRRSIVRSYARAAGLDEETWVKRYLEISQPVETVISEEDRAWAEFAENVGRSRGRDSESGSNNMRWAGVVALLLLVIGMSWFVWGYVHNKAAAAAKSPGVSSALTAQSTSAIASY
jgi:cytoskeleton protein RodZ